MYSRDLYGQISQDELRRIFNRVLRLFPELKIYKVKLDITRGNPSISPQGEVRRRGDHYIVKLFANLIEDEIDAEFIIAHELSHVLLDPENVPLEGESLNMSEFEMYSELILEVICDFIALRRLERAYANDFNKLKQLYSRYLKCVNPEGYVSSLEGMKEKVAMLIKERYGDKLRQLLKECFLGLDIDIRELDMFALLGIMKYFSL